MIFSRFTAFVLVYTPFVTSTISQSSADKPASSGSLSTFGIGSSFSSSTTDSKSAEAVDSASSSSSFKLVGIIASAIRTGLAEQSANSASTTLNAASQSSVAETTTSSTSGEPSASRAPSSPGTTSTLDLHYPASLWNDPTPVVTCQPPCNIVLPPYTLTTQTTFTWSPVTTTLTEQWSSGTDILTTTQTTVLSFAPLTTSILPLFNLNITAGGASQFSLTPSVFPIASGTILPPSGVTPTSASTFSLTSFPQSASSAQSSIAPIPPIPGLPVHIGFEVGPPPPNVCTLDCAGTSNGGYGSKCQSYCNSCGSSCSPGGSSGGGTKPCVGNACPPPPGSGGTETGGGGGPGPSPKTNSPDPGTKTDEPSPSSTLDPSSAEPSSSEQPSSSSDACEFSITVSDCRATCTDTVASGSTASQSSCHIAACSTAVTGCSGEVTGTTSTTRTTTSAPACPYYPPPTQWWTAEDQVLPTLPGRDEMTWVWSSVDGWPTLRTPESSSQPLSSSASTRGTSSAQTTQAPQSSSEGSSSTTLSKPSGTYTSAIEVVYHRANEVDPKDTESTSDNAYRLWSYDGPIPASPDYCDDDGLVYSNETEQYDGLTWSEMNSGLDAPPFPLDVLKLNGGGTMPGGQKACQYSYFFGNHNGGVVECGAGFIAPVTCTSVPAPFQAAKTTSCESGPTQTFLPLARCQWSGET